MAPTSKTTTDLNMRSSPEVTPTNRIKTLASGTEFAVTGNFAQWLAIEHKGKTGFVNGDSTTSLVEVNDNPIWITVVTSDGLNVRNERSMAAAAVVGQVAKGDQLEVLGHAEGWLRIRRVALEGWVAATRTASVQFQAMATQPGQLGALMSKARLTTTELADAHKRINAINNAQQRGDLFEALQAKTVYRNQRDNKAVDAAGNLVETRSGQMCNLTSLAMCLDYLGIPNPHPAMQYEDALEKVRVAKGLPARTDSKGWGGVAAQVGAKVTFLGSNVKKTQKWYVDNVLPSLRTGNAVMMSVCGHIVRVQPVTNEGLIVDDPYGRGTMLANPGCNDRKWKYAATNEFQQPNQTVGEDNIWPWANVSTHCMRWIARISRVGLPADEIVLPEEQFSDDGIVVPEQPD